MNHPCLSCGACCATYRVSFYGGEAIPGPGAVPEDLVENLTPFLVAMKGTNQPEPRCCALEGTVGGEVRCTIYPLRSSTCRELEASWEHGEAVDRCDRARIRHGLSPLQREDWDPNIPRSPSGRPGGTKAA